MRCMIPRKYIQQSHILVCIKIEKDIESNGEKEGKRNMR